MEENGEENGSIDIKHENTKELAIDVPENLVDLLSQPALWPEICIYKVPRKLRAINPSAYTPQMISIGPYHYHHESLKPMHNHKIRYLAEFCKRTGKKWVDLAGKIEECEVKIRHCYDQTFELYGSNIFVKMILLDAVFIIEFFLRRGESLLGLVEKYKTDYILGKSSREHALLDDLILLENQLPYFVLETLYEFATGNSGFLSLVRLNLSEYLLPPEVEERKRELISCHCFSFFYGFWITKCFFCRKKPNDSESVLEKHIEPPFHFTDIVRKSRSYKHPVSKTGNVSVKRLYSATKLHEAGVKFKVDEEAWPLGIKFEGGVLKMPRFEVEDGTERVIRNLMAFEQCHYPNDPYICEYILILDFLVDTEKDVELLIQNGVITNLLGECKSVADLINKLCLEIRASGSCFYDLSVQLNDHYENLWYNAVAIMRSVYFSNLWRGTGTIAALLLLFLTFIQSVNSIRRMF